MSAQVTARPTGPGRRGEDGLTLVELAIASAIAISMLLASSVSITATGHASQSEIAQGSTTNQAITDAAALQTFLSGAYDSGSVAGVSTECAGGSSGQAFPTGQGPFVSATSTDVMFCGFRNSSLTSYTYEIHFTNCDAKSVCTLKVDQEPDPSCASACTVSTVFVASGVSDQGAKVGGGTVAPFTFYTYDGTSSPPSWQTTSTLGAIEAVQVSMTVYGSTGAGTAVERLIALPNTITGGA